MKRFTPAHAGNTPKADINRNAYQVHPRSRGEYLIFITTTGGFIGSPPLTRGIRSYDSTICKLDRFTPAHAGNTFCNHHFQFLDEVHPRSRGEYYVNPLYIEAIQGSPPLTRGILQTVPMKRFRLRFTPAHAGNTPKIRAS